MTRNLKALGLALVAVFAFSAVAASGASAQQLTASEPVTLIGEETGGAGANALTSFGGKTECPGSTITGHKIGVAGGFIPSGATEVTLTPHYKNCSTTDKNGNKFSTTVDMNGCDYKGKVGSTTEGDTGLAYGFDVQIVCPGGKNIQVTLFSSSSHAFRVCTITVTNTTLTSHAHVGNDTSTSPDHLWVSGEFTNIKVHKSGLCGTESDEAGKFHIDNTVEGFNEEGTKIAVTVTH